MQKQLQAASKDKNEVKTNPIGKNDVKIDSTENNEVETGSSDKNNVVIDDTPVGPGYMGWNVTDEADILSAIDFKKRVMELKEGYDEMKKEFESMKHELIVKEN